ncbi:MAG: flagellin [Sphingomonadales bacterium]|nr:MAG: flagellin [Sphingomonadales bacterium]TNF02926.1 MAG: flagellin [Sphingomonadales bacterium]
MVAITAQTMADEIRRQQKLSSGIADLQASISSGKQLTKSSQNPQNWVQISEIGRAQAQQAAWSANVTYAQSRAQKAETNMNDITTLMTRAQELIISANNTTLDDANRAAIAAEMEGIRETVTDLLNEKDYLGVPVFDQGEATMIPVGKNYSVAAVPTQESLAEGIDVNGTPMSLDQILSDAIAAVTSPNSADRDATITALEAASDHVTLARTLQGVRADRLDKAQERIDTVSLGLSERRSALEDTDLTSAIAMIQSKLVSLQAAQATYAKISQQSLFDLIR